MLDMYSGKENVCALKDVKSIYEKKKKEEEQEGVMKKKEGRNKGRERHLMKIYRVTYAIVWRKIFPLSIYIWRGGVLWLNWQ